MSVRGALEDQLVCFFELHMNHTLYSIALSLAHSLVSYRYKETKTLPHHVLPECLFTFTLMNRITRYIACNQLKPNVKWQLQEFNPPAAACLPATRWGICTFFGLLCLHTHSAGAAGNIILIVMTAYLETSPPYQIATNLLSACSCQPFSTHSTTSSLM